jgi:hypothetical protein
MQFLQLEVFGFVLESVALNLVLERTRLNYARVLIVPKSRIQSRDQRASRPPRAAGRVEDSRQGCAPDWLADDRTDLFVKTDSGSVAVINPDKTAEPRRDYRSAIPGCAKGSAPVVERYGAATRIHLAPPMSCCG